MLVFEVTLRKHSHGVLGIRLEFRTVTFLQLPFIGKCPLSLINSTSKVTNPNTWFLCLNTAPLVRIFGEAMDRQWQINYHHPSVFMVL